MVGVCVCACVSGSPFRINIFLHSSRDDIVGILHTAQLKFLAPFHILPRFRHVYIELLLPHIESTAE